jgi:hypothetical protein
MCTNTTLRDAAPRATDQYDTSHAVSTVDHTVQDAAQNGSRPPDQVCRLTLGCDTYSEFEVGVRGVHVPGCLCTHLIRFMNLMQAVSGHAGMCKSVLDGRYGGTDALFGGAPAENTDPCAPLSGWKHLSIQACSWSGGQTAPAYTRRAPPIRL